MKQRIVLLGPPASGKGSQARMISKKYGIPAVSTGHLLRDEADAGTSLGKSAAAFTSRGNLAPDDLALNVLKTWLDGGRNTFILDGFPRTLVQAELLQPVLDEMGTPLDAVIALECSRSVIEDRILNRISCTTCDRIYKAGADFEIATQECPNCGGLLMRRGDDTSEVLSQRMQQYEEKTAPVLEYYQQRNLLQRINAETELSTVFAAMEAALLA